MTSVAPQQYSDLQDVQDLLDRLRTLAEGARGLPLSTSCVVDRQELLRLVEALRDRLPHALVRAQAVLGDREAVVAGGRREAEDVVAAAHEQRERLLAGTEVVEQARVEAERVLQAGREQSDALRSEAELYVDTRLATFEVVLARTQQAVALGRARLAGEHELDELREDPEQARAERAMLASADEPVRLPD